MYCLIQVSHLSCTDLVISQLGSIRSSPCQNVGNTKETAWAVIDVCNISNDSTSSVSMVLTLQDYFAGLLVDEIKQQSSAQPFRQTLQGVLANLQSLYQHNQLIFQVGSCHCMIAATVHYLRHLKLKLYVVDLQAGC